MQNQEKQSVKKKTMKNLGVREKADLLAQIAHYSYVDELGQKDIIPIIKERVDITSSSSIAQYLKEARELGVVSFDIDPAFGICGKEDEHLSRNLRGHFHLEEAMVVRWNSNEEEYKDRPKEKDDDLHLALGNQLGQLMRDRIRPADHIAVGSGRAVCHTARVIKQRPPHSRDIHITPLCGRIWSHSWQATGPLITRPLDADDAAFALFSAFEHEPGVRFTQITSPLYTPSKEQAIRVMNRCPFEADGTWRFGVPQIAIVGVGAVDPDSGHRINDLYRETIKKTEDEEVAIEHSFLIEVAEDLLKAIAFIKNCEEDIPYFGDITNRLFPSLRIPSDIHWERYESLTECYHQLANMLSDINDKMVVVQWKHLKEVPSVMAIAGGDFKLEALWTLLLARYLSVIDGDPSLQIITSMTTDDLNAAKLQKALNAYEMLEGYQKEWYKDMIKLFFNK